ncbi:MAG TPA: hypothetical protein VGG29_09710 [Caulobacteraceae bacterium]|jgi:hypothetical protein
MTDEVAAAQVPRDAGGRFAPGGPGRPVGTRNRVSARVARMILRDFEANAEEMLPRVRRWFAPQYLQLVGRLLPRDPEGPELEGLSDEEAARMAAELRAALELVEERAASPTGVSDGDAPEG